MQHGVVMAERVTDNLFQTFTPDVCKQFRRMFVVVFHKPINMLNIHINHLLVSGPSFLFVYYCDNETKFTTLWVHSQSFPLIFMAENYYESKGRILKRSSVNPFPNNNWFLRVCSTGLLKTLWEKEKLLVTSNFSFSHSVFFTFG